jgi:hypothetical protein
MGNYTAPPTKAAGNALASSDWNTYIKQNIDKGVVRPLSDTTLGSPVANVDLTGIDQNFGALYLVVRAQSALAANVDDLCVRINGDAGANYHFFGFRANNTTVVPNSAFATGVGLLLGECPGSLFPTRFSSNAMLIPNYASATFRKSAQLEGGFASNAAATSYFDSYSGFWDSVAAITQLTVRANGGNLVAGTRVTLYGFAV